MRGQIVEVDLLFFLSFSPLALVLLTRLTTMSLSIEDTEPQTCGHMLCATDDSSWPCLVPSGTQ